MAAGGKNGKLPPAALVEVYQDLEAEVAKLRRFAAYISLLWIFNTPFDLLKALTMTRKVAY